MAYHMRYYLFLILLFIYSYAQAITQEEAARMVDTAFTHQFGSHYDNNVLFYDGTGFHLAHALARSGPVSSGGCGYDLINPCIAVTFDLATDSAGADDEGTTVLKMNPPIIPTLDSALMMANRFLEQTVQGPAGINNSEIPKEEGREKGFYIQSPNNGKRFSIRWVNTPTSYTNIIDIYTIEGRYITRAVVSNGVALTETSLPTGRFIGSMKNDGQKSLVSPFIVIR